MGDPKNYLVIEENVVFRGGQYQLLAGESLVITEFANASFYRIEAEQSDGHPGKSSPSAVVSGCNDEDLSCLVNQFALDDKDVFTDIDCNQSLDVFDPNGRFAQPRGYDDNHFIEKNEPIEYVVNFENTGSDTTNKLVITEMLSEFLDPSSITFGPSSHNYEATISGIGALTFTFYNIDLSGSGRVANESSGYVSYKITPKEDVEIGTVVESISEIYFDYKEPILTNSVFHTIGEDFVPKEIIDGINPTSNELGITIYPNPNVGLITLDLDKVRPNKQLTINISNQIGQLIWSDERIANEKIPIDLSEFSRGIYFIEIIDKNSNKLYQNSIVLGK